MWWRELREHRHHEKGHEQDPYPARVELASGKNKEKD